MSVLEQAEALLARLNAAEKAQLIQAAARDLGGAFPGVESRPDVCGGEACIVRTRIPVWLLEQARRSGKSEAELLQIIRLCVRLTLPMRGLMFVLTVMRLSSRSPRTKPPNGALLFQRKHSVASGGAT